MRESGSEAPIAAGPWSSIEAYLAELHARHASIDRGEVAAYIPELAKADPRDHRLPQSVPGRRRLGAAAGGVAGGAARTRQSDRAVGATAQPGARAPLDRGIRGRPPDGPDPDLGRPRSRAGTLRGRDPRGARARSEPTRPCPYRGERSAPRSAATSDRRRQTSLALAAVPAGRLLGARARGCARHLSHL